MQTRTGATVVFLFTIIATRASGQQTTAGASDAPAYARYPTPAACVAAVERVDVAARWGEDSDSLSYDPSRSLPAAAVATARRCVERFLPAAGIAAIADPDVDAMYFLGLAAGNDALAAAALRRTVAVQRSGRDSLEVLTNALDMYVRGRPRRLALAQRVASQLDSLNYHPDLPPGRWSNPHTKVLDLAWATLDSAAMAQEAEALLTAVRALPERARGGRDILGAVMSALSGDLLWTLRAHGPDSALAQIKRRVAALLGPDALETSRLAYALPLMGKPAPRLQPDFWFGRDPGDSVLPRPGQVTLVVYGCGLCNNAVLRRLKTRLGDSLEVVLWAQTSGRRGPYMPLTPDREAELIREAVLETARLSAKLGVWTTSFTSVPDPDRRRRPREPAPDLGRYQGAVWFVDSRGIMFPALRDAHSADGEAFVAAMADALVRRPWEHAAAAK